MPSDLSATLHEIKYIIQDTMYYPKLPTPTDTEMS